MAIAAAIVHAAAGAAGADPAQTTRQVLERTNAFRAAQGLPPVAVSRELQATAESFARYMADTGNYGHAADGRKPVDRAAAQGYDACIVSENIARLYRSAGYDAATLAHDLLEGWKQSQEHRKAMLDPAVTQAGVGLAQAENGRYFGVQMFGRPKAAAIRFSLRNQSTHKVDYTAGERRFSLAPRAERTHTVCRPLEITVALPKPFTTAARNGASYVVREREGGLVVQTAPAEAR